MRRSRHAPLLLALVLLLAACAAQLGSSADAGTPDPTAPAERTPDPTPAESAPALGAVPPSAAPVIGEIPAPIMAALRADAADRAGVDPGAIEVLQAENVTWNDGSLGCPQPGTSYTMALVDGYHVILAAEGEEFDYRVTGDGAFRLCENVRRLSR
jgi:hypothetical protein